VVFRPECQLTTQPQSLTIWRMKILFSDHDPKAEIGDKPAYCHTIILAKGESEENPFSNTSRIFTEEQLRAAESIPADIDLSAGTGKRFEWLKAPGSSRLSSTDGCGLEIKRFYLRAPSWSRLLYKTAE